MVCRIGVLSALFGLVPFTASAQSITTVPATAVPVASPWLLAALWLTLLLSAMWMLRHRRRQAGALITALLLATGLWIAHAQAGLQFTNPAGETVTLPVTQILSGSDVQGFERPVFTNATDVSLQISAIDEPDFADCFPTGLNNTLPPPDPFTDTACTVGLVLAAGESCTVNVDAICRDRADETDATIAVAPATLVFAENASGSVTVTNDGASLVPAVDPIATIPGGSSITVQSTTCGATLFPGASCTITFASAATEGPTSISISGDNTNTEVVDITVVAAPTIALTSPVQQNRIITVSGAALSLEVTNDAGSATNATSITVTNHAAAPNLIVDDSDCVSVAPGASCTLELSSSTPYAPGTISIGGSNTANTPTTLVVFSYLGGLVFEESGGSGKVVIDVAQGFTSQWTTTFVDLAGASSPDTGAANTDAIVADAACTNAPGNCAAQRCRNISADWYLPARNELLAVASALCSNGAIPCNAGGFDSSFHWSSTSLGAPSALGALFPGQAVLNGKLVSAQVRCVRAF